MFSLRIYSVDFPEGLPTSFISSTCDSYDRIHPTELTGVIHLFKQLPLPSASSTDSTTIIDPSLKSLLLFVVAVPNYISSDDFFLFCCTHLNQFEQVLFIRNGAVDDRYSVLIRLVSQSDADEFYSACNGKRFKPSDAELCHIYFTQSVEFTDFPEIASTPPPGFMELPSCPICLERLDQDTSGIQRTICGHSFHCSCVSIWSCLSCQVCQFCQQHDDRPSCSVCGTLDYLWICLICGFVGCGRYKGRHGISHWNDTQHQFTLELETQQIWNYVGDKYVHRLDRSKSDGKMTYSRCVTNGECGSYGYEDESGLDDGALFNSRVDAIVDDHDHLLSSQLEIERQRNKELLKNHELLQQKCIEIEERLSSSLRDANEKILDLEEQVKCVVRDLKMYVEGQRMIANKKDSEIQGGSVISTEASNHSRHAD